MGLLDSLLGGGQQQQHQDFVNRYEQGQPAEGYSGQEVMDRYQQVAPQLSQGEYVQAAEQAFGRMSPQDRMQFGQFVQGQAQQQGIGLGQMNPQSMQDPRYLAQMTGQIHQQQPGLLGQLLGGGMGGMGGMGGNGMMGAAEGVLANPAAKAALAGIAAMALKNAMHGGM